MRNVCLKVAVLALALVGLAGGALRTEAQQTLATLTVIADTEAPRLVQAVINNIPPGGGTPYGTNTINVHFDELLNGTSARNINNYRVVLASNPSIEIPIRTVLYTSHQLGVLIQVDGTNANWNPEGNYYLIVNNVVDSRGNYIAPNSVIGVSIRVTTSLTQMNDLWNYYGNAFFDPDWPGIYSQFHRTNFVMNPTFWGTDVGIFWFDGFPMITLCAGDTLGRHISDQDTVPTLFRRTFPLPAGFSRTATFRLRYMVDDGMVLYLNGVEIHRYNMPLPPTVITENTRATLTIENPTCTTNVTVTVTNLLPGTSNWLAAAVHAGPASQNDIYFGLEMDVVTLQTSPTPTNRPPAPRLAYTKVLTNGGRHFVLSWPATNYGYTLQYSTNIASVGPHNTHAGRWWTNQANWFQVSDQSNPYTNRVPPTTGPRRFYRLWRETLN